MVTMFERLPEQAFSLPAAHVEPYIAALQIEHGLSDEVAELCREGLHQIYLRHGGYDEPPTDPQGEWYRNHNGSHSAAVLGAGLHLTHLAGGRPLAMNAMAVGTVWHDFIKSNPKAPDDEERSAQTCQEVLSSYGLHQLTGMTTRIILGTRADVKGAFIKQMASRSRLPLTRIGADADLAVLAAPNVAPWALRLYVEETPEHSLEGAVVYLRQTANIQRHHRFLSNAGQRALQPLLEQRAEYLEAYAPRLAEEIYPSLAA